MPISKRAFKDGYQRLSGQWVFLAANGRAAVTFEALSPLMSDAVWAATVRSALLRENETPTIAKLIEHADAVALRVCRQTGDFYAVPSQVATTRIIDGTTTHETAQHKLLGGGNDRKLTS